MDILSAKNKILSRLSELDQMLYEINAGKVVNFRLDDIEKLRRVNQHFLLALDLLEQKGRPLSFVKLRQEETALN